MEEYLKDTNFEQNRLEYKANKAAADRALNGSSRTGLKTSMCLLYPVNHNSFTVMTASPTSITPPVPKVEPGVATNSSKPVVNAKVDDFFESLEKDNQASPNPTR